jgi:hypothetical protein
VFEVVCKGCGRSLVTVERVGDPEIDAIRDHVATCARGEQISPASPLGAVLAHIRMTRVTE